LRCYVAINLNIRSRILQWTGSTLPFYIGSYFGESPY
jgi:hypothetical protein